MQRLTLTQGDQATLQIAITNSDGTALDLTDYPDMLFTIKRSKQDSDIAAIFQGSLPGDAFAVLDPASDGLVQITIPAANTVLLRSGRVYYWDVQITDTDGNPVTPESGELVVTEEVTRG